jgi:hypothetical protein
MIIGALVFYLLCFFQIDFLRLYEIYFDMQHEEGIKS